MQSKLFSDYINEWLELQRTSLQPSTYRTYASQVNIIHNYFKRKPIYIDNITDKDVNLFYAHLSRQGMSNSRIVKYHSNVYSCIKSLVIDDILPNSILLKIKRPKTQKYVPKPLNFNDINTLYQFAVTNYTHKLSAPIILGLFFGLRRSEAVAVAWNNIDLVNGHISIVQKIEDGGSKENTKVSTSLKSEKSLRILKIPDFLIDYLELLNNHRLKLQSELNKDIIFLCIDNKGDRISLNYVTKYFRKVCSEIGIKSIRFHDLRHTNATMLLELGSNMKEIQEWLGHSDFQTTANIYTHLTSKSKDKLAGLMNKHFSPIKK